MNISEEVTTIRIGVVEVGETNKRVRGYNGYRVE